WCWRSVLRRILRAHLAYQYLLRSLSQRGSFAEFCPGLCGFTHSLVQLAPRLAVLYQPAATGAKPHRSAPHRLPEFQDRDPRATARDLPFPPAQEMDGPSPAGSTAYTCRRDTTSTVCAWDRSPTLPETPLQPRQGASVSIRDIRDRNAPPARLD